MSFRSAIRVLFLKSKLEVMMRLEKIRSVTLLALLALGSQSALANHISPLGIDVSLVSSDGAGNFQIRIDEYMSAYGELWVGDVAYAGDPAPIGQWDATSSSPNFSISMSGASVSGPGTATLGYQGMANASKSMFSNSSTQWAVNFDVDGFATDVAKYSAIVNYSIAGYSPAQAYSITAAVSDCCEDVAPPTLVTAHGSTTFNVAAVPVPAAAWLLGSGLLGLIGVARKSRA
jgi:hypothetical protein